MRKIWVIGLLLGILLVDMSLISPVKGDMEKEFRAGEVRATVIIEFGNHEDMSYTVALPQDNHTALKATELACENLSLYFHYVWYSGMGALVDQIGWDKNDYSNTGFWWHFMVWKNDSYEWEMSSNGASSVNLSNGDVISWVYTVDDSNWNPYTTPSEIIGHYSAFSSMRGNLNNTGVADGYILGHNITWKFKSQSSSGFSSTPISYHGMIFIADSTNLYALNTNGSLIWNNSKGAAGYGGISSPVAFGNYVLIGTSDRYVRAFYVNNGTMAWEHYIGEDITSAPVVDIVDKYPVVFVATFNLNSSGKLHAINFTNGNELWNLTLLGSNYFGIPAVLNGNIYVPIAGIENSSYQWNPPYGIQCVDEHGKYIWNLTLPSSIRSSPVIKNDTMYFVTAGGNLSAVNLTSHTFKWNYTVGSSTSSPAINGNVIYVANDNGNVSAIEDNGNKAVELWKKNVNGKVKSSILYAHGKIAVVTDTSNSILYILSEDGNELWNYTPQPANYILSSPTIADSCLLIASNNGYLYGLSDNSSLPAIRDIVNSSAIVGQSIKISFSSPQEEQAVLYYENVSGDRYHAVIMNYSSGRYVGYIPKQSLPGVIHYYITLVSNDTQMRSTKIGEINVQSEVPEFSAMYTGISLLIFMAVYWRRKL